VITWRRPSDDELLERARSVEPCELSYSEVGTTQRQMPRGYRHDRYERGLGSGEKVWSAATVAVMDWTAHTYAGVRVVPHSRPAEGVVVTLAFQVGPAYVIAPCRVVLVVDDPDRVGFVYGTLPGHPECGEESFMVERAPDGTTRFAITAFSKPAEITARLAAPISREIQRRVTDRYLDGLSMASRGSGQ
jgi:uncharacterized protein (UPF0548 family)